MKSLFFTTFILLSSVMLFFAQSPDLLSYQAVLRDDQGVLIKNQEVGIKISIIQSMPEGLALYEEIHTGITNANGLISLNVGGGDNILNEFEDIDWSLGPFFLKTQIDPNGGQNYTIETISQLLSVPYALYAKKAGSVDLPSPSFKHRIGEFYQGGIIFHLWKDEEGIEHGLIVSITDQGTLKQWSNILTISTEEKAISNWNGLKNSLEIIAQEGHTESAAQICLDYSYEGYDDWYLPAIDELSLLWHNRYNINRKLETTPNAKLLTTFALYWSSTSNFANSALGFSFGEGIIKNSNKEFAFNVRAIREFKD